MTGVIDRRDLLRLLGLATLAVAGASGLAGCGSDPSEASGDGSSDVRTVSADVPRADGDPGAAAGLVEELGATGAALYGELAAGQPGNLAVSPYSVLVALAMTLNGAAGETRDELLALFGGADGAEVNAGLNALTEQVEALSGPLTKADGTETEVVLDAANGLFGQRGLAFGAPFLETLAREYGAAVQTVDYVADPEAARAAVNGWTAEQTREKIPAILPPGTVDDLTRLVLVNALYLKAPWEQPFEPSATTAEPFTLLDGSEVSVDLMRSSGPVADRGVVADGWQGVRLAYAGGGLAMTVVLPDAGRFAEVEADLVARGTGAYLEALRPAQATVRLPRWTFRTQAPLVEALRRLGVSAAFEPGRADLSPMTEEEDLHLAAALHEVFIAVDEEGTEAAAATAVVAGTTSAPVVDLELVADRPFLFVVHDVELGTPLFLGRVVDPR
jgi:serpin B